MAASVLVAAVMAAGVLGAWMAMGEAEPVVAARNDGQVAGASSFGAAGGALISAATSAAESVDVDELERAAARRARAAETVSQLSTASGITATTYPSVIESASWQQLETAVAAFTGKGYELGFVLIDLETQMSARYGADTFFYPASSAKAPYCAYIFESNGGAAGLSSTIRNCIVNSDNDAYRALQRTFGSRGYAAWLTKLGATGPAARAARYYPEFTAEELALVWQEIYRYGSSGEPGASELTGYLAQTTKSALRDAAGAGTTVWNKAGWYPADGAGLQVTNDAGIVFSAQGAYLLAVMSDAPADFSALDPVVRALEAVHAEMRR